MEAGGLEILLAGREGRAERGREGSGSRCRACSEPGKLILLMRTFLAMSESWLVRRVNGCTGVADERRRIVCGGDEGTEAVAIGRPNACICISLSVSVLVPAVAALETSFSVSVGVGIALWACPEP